jgi:hypothetical protein
MGSRPKKQHYIPQLVLRRFRVPDGDQLWVFDKSNSKGYISAVKDVASENYFNDVRLKDWDISFENRLELVETQVAPVIERIVSSEDVSQLSAGGPHLPSHKSGCPIFARSHRAKVGIRAKSKQEFD